MVIRSGLIWGPGDHGHVSMVYSSVARTGAACYVGEGLNTYSSVHIDDVARLFATALNQGTAGALYHAVAGEIPNRWIAEAVAHDLGCGTRSLTEDEGTAVWGEFGALIMAASSRGRAPRIRQDLGWAPHHTDMLTMIGEPRLRELAIRWRAHPAAPAAPFAQRTRWVCAPGLGPSEASAGPPGAGDDWTVEFGAGLSPAQKRRGVSQ
ncbi:hypothetical protein [Streptomyces sp. NPDC059479]|uniref:hypothetical protein n=1 Tax=Streptomyces sp. NPDC059479 TaxID=3346848 RepID=UPI00367909E4